MGDDLTAPDEGSASSPGEIADALCKALNAFTHVDYKPSCPRSSTGSCSG